ncbi:hypothetical protein V5799_019098 [Amblyomma americanum]|uniref:Uncharacterized protein n=1 Tax=Amblyomma americanum TaxID=6943 RepID=A0AAQ4EXS6_AMBAM
MHRAKSSECRPLVNGRQQFPITAYEIKHEKRSNRNLQVRVTVDKHRASAIRGIQVLLCFSPFKGDLRL